MKSKLKRPVFYLPALIIFIILCNILYFSYDRGAILNDSCVSVLRMQEFTTGFSSTETLTLVVNPNKSGYIALSGNVFYQGKPMILFREIRFRYEKETHDIYKLYDIETVKNSRDNTPDSLIESVFFSTKHQKPRYMIVRKIMNAYVIGNLHSPVFMCVVK
ncbi:hypothetical protein IV04_17190 [Serratia sp. Ag1]|nr:hypothetical protein JV45_16230 [Serratia sp. Ag2]KFK97043.1 hypothetical protein IV04_17190 [Serratia sp. Ag1]